MSGPLVSVYMTVRNGGKWIVHAIRSVQLQTLREWELIVVDDGSTDNTLGILKTFAASDRRIRVIPTGGVGRGAALNLALQHCTADFVANLDADDLAHPYRLEIQHRIAKEHPEFGLLASKSIIIEGENAPEWVPINKELPTVSDVTEKLAYYNPINHSSVFARREVLLRVGGYNETLRSHLDYDLWVRLVVMGYRLGEIDLPLAAKRWHKDQSFEARAHIKYVMRSLSIQAKAIRALQPGLSAWFYWMGRFGWALIPRSWRLAVRRGGRLPGVTC